MRTTKHIQSEYGDGFEYTFDNGRKLYTIEYGNSSNIDFYENTLSWVKAMEDGVPNEGRIESMPNCFLCDGNENTFYTVCAAYAVCGDIKRAFEAVDEMFDMDDKGGLQYKRTIDEETEEVIL